ncbi:hypothetical protein [Nocardioides sp.]|uniref:hypothetical protein n=1 Tax=Nocardioides sp. TaxID=35761 RepID=UPI000C94C8C3|nr:hypothetical protein [Nocardioides sp.]MAS56027.1 cellulose synthase [Pimelobacter sp.]MDE0774746.1 hypothetical protein [Nocardioides sp.]
MDDVAWGALTLSLTLLGAIYTWYAYRRRGLAPALRGAALTLLPVAALLTRTLQMFTEIADAITGWATRLVFSPTVWVGVVVAGISVLLLGAARVVDRRGTGSGRTAPRTPSAPGRSAGKRVETSDPADDDMADIEAILRKRGIS